MHEVNVDTQKRIVRVSYTCKATIPSGQAYQNIQPCYTVTQEVPIPDTLSNPTVIQDYAETEVKAQTEWMKKYVDSLIDEDMRHYKGFIVRETPPDDHFRVLNGVKVPRVTAIITPDKPPIPYIEDYAELGNMLDTCFKQWGITQDIPPMADFNDKGRIKETWADLYDQFGKWVAKFGDKFHIKEDSILVHDADINACGEVDAIGLFEGKRAIIDCKKTKSITGQIKDKYFTQCAAYDLLGHYHADIYVIVSPYNPPIVTDEVNKYQSSFMTARQSYRDRFGI